MPKAETPFSFGWGAWTPGFRKEHCVLLLSPCTAQMTGQAWMHARIQLPPLASEPVGHICPDVTSFTNSHKDIVLWCSLVFLAKTTTTKKSLLQVYSSYTVMMLMCGPEEKKITTIQLSTGGLNKMLYHWFLSTELSRDVAGIFLIDLPKNI